jgi:hypothetical protein
MGHKDADFLRIQSDHDHFSRRLSAFTIAYANEIDE